MIGLLKREHLNSAELGKPTVFQRTALSVPS